MKRSIGRPVWTMIVLAAAFAAGCVAPLGSGPSPEERTAADIKPTDAPPAPPNSPALEAVVDVTSDADGENALLARLAQLTKSECFGSGEGAILFPDSKDLEDVDRQVSGQLLVGGRDAKQRLVGSEADLLAQYDSAVLVARSARPIQSWFIGTVDSRTTGMQFLGIQTPAGNLVWIETMRAFPVAC